MKNYDAENINSFAVVKCYPAAFTGGTEDTRGDHNGALDPTTLFTVTGDILVRMFGVVTTTLVGAGTIEVGVTENTVEILAQVADTTSMATGDIWVDATVDDVRAGAFADVIATRLITNGSDIIETIGAANITEGRLYYIALWKPLTPGSKLVSAI